MAPLTRHASPVVLVLIIAACSSTVAGSTPSSSVLPSWSPSASAPTSTPGASGAIDHATGATDVILRYEEGGGFVTPASIAASAPIFTLYGDGTLIFRDLSKEPLPAVGSVMPFLPYRTAKMSEEQVQSLLEYGLHDGGLGAARPRYPNDSISDQPTAVFTFNAAGLTKTVSVYALDVQTDQPPELLARRPFVRLRDRLLHVDEDGSIKTRAYVPDRYRAILLEGQPGAPDQRAWPWTDIEPSDFVADGDPNVPQMPTRVMTVADVQRLGIEPYQGGFVGLPLAGPSDGKFYSLSLRPLLPDDTK